MRHDEKLKSVKLNGFQSNFVMLPFLFDGGSNLWVRLWVNYSLRALRLNPIYPGGKGKKIYLTNWCLSVVLRFSGCVTLWNTFISALCDSWTPFNICQFCKMLKKWKENQTFDHLLSSPRIEILQRSFDLEVGIYFLRLQIAKARIRDNFKYNLWNLKALSLSIQINIC